MDCTIRVSRRLSYDYIIMCDYGSALNRPMTGIACCAYTVNGNTAAAPKTAKNCRRFIGNLEPLFFNGDCTLAPCFTSSEVRFGSWSCKNTLLRESMGAMTVTVS